MPEYTFKCRKCAEITSLFCSISAYDEKKEKIKCSSCKSKRMDRDFEADNIGGFVSISLSDCKTIGHYADKQTSRYTKTQLEDMKEWFKTKKTGGMTELPEGMTRMKPSTNNKEK